MKSYNIVGNIMRESRRVKRKRGFGVRKFPLFQFCPVLILILVLPCRLTAQWLVNGISICHQYNDQDRISVVADNSGGAYMVWRDGRTGDFTNNGFLYGQHVTSAGVILWPTDGLHLQTGKGALYQDVVKDGDGGLYMCWEDFRLSAPGVYIQRVTSSGPSWQDSGVFVREKSRLPRVCSAGSEGVYLVWVDENTSGLYPDIYAQKYDVGGSAQWQTPGIPVCADNTNTYSPQATRDGSGGIFVVFVKDSASAGGPQSAKSNLFVQRLDANGSMLWDSAGIPLCMAPNKQMDMRIWSDNNGYAYAAWNDFRSGINQIYAQKWDNVGNMLWQQNGKPISIPSTGAFAMALISDGAGGIIIVEKADNLYGSRISSAGDILWRKSLCTNSPPKASYASVASTANGGFVLAWQDYRYDMGDIFAQKVNVDGDLLWNPIGVPLCQYSSQQRYVSVCHDGSGGIIGAWEDQRPGTWMIDVFAAKINASGYPVPVELIHFNGLQDDRSIALTWSTATETNNSGFFVERNLGAGWSTIGFVQGAGNSTSGRAYRYRDNEVSALLEGGERKISYRLRQVDFDGTSAYSQTVEVFWSLVSAEVILHQNYPNPVGNRLVSGAITNIEFALPAERTNEHWRLTLYDALGREAAVLFDGIPASSNVNIQFDAASLRPGVYRYLLAAGQTRTGKSMTVCN